MRLAHLSDIHFGGENQAAVAGVLAWLTAEPPDLVVLTGDVTRFGHVPEFEAARDFLAGLPCPWLAIPGNHDTPHLGVWARITGPFDLFKAYVGQADRATWTGDGARVAAVNTARGVQIRINWSKGEITRRQATAALSALAPLAPGDLRVIACHHPLVEMVGGPMTARVRGGEDAARRFCAGAVDLILTGHIHAPFAMPLPYGDGQTYAVGASTLSVRERGVPAGFNLIETSDETIAVTAKGWSGAGYEDWRSWTFRRRAAA
ncbi:MAG: metallophosphoesterase [Caulobacteraceae bacterium]|nr:metallophosphoesterase [Caulobacteraceae bacterium]